MDKEGFIPSSILKFRMMKLSLLEKIQTFFAYKYARRMAFKKNIEKIKYGEIGKTKMTMSKKLTIFLLINFIVIQIYSMVVMLVRYDLSALPTLISVVVGEVMVLFGYLIKSMIENKSGGVTFETAMYKLHNDNNNSVG